MLHNLVQMKIISFIAYYKSKEGGSYLSSLSSYNTENYLHDPDAVLGTVREEEVVWSLPLKASASLEVIV